MNKATNSAPVPEVPKTAPAPTPKKNSLITAGFILGIIALALSWIPVLGVVLGVISAVLLLPQLIKSIKTKKAPSTQSGQFIAGCILAFLALFISLFMTIGVFTASSPSKPKEKYTGDLLEEIDLNGLTISEACKEAREKGWKISEVAGSGDYSEKSDCSNTEKKVTAYYYHNLDESYNAGTVSLRFANQAKETAPTEDKKDDSSSSSSSSSDKSSDSSSSSSNSSSSSSDNSSSNTSNNSSTSSSSGYQSIYNTYSARLRAECPNLSMMECAELSNEGITKMAEYMFKASGKDGQYETYSDWAGKLQDVYMEAVL